MSSSADGGAPPATRARGLWEVALLDPRAISLSELSHARPHRLTANGRYSDGIEQGHSWQETGEP